MNGTEDGKGDGVVIVILFSLGAVVDDVVVDVLVIVELIVCLV